MLVEGNLQLLINLQILSQPLLRITNPLLQFQSLLLLLVGLDFQLLDLNTLLGLIVKSCIKDEGDVEVIQLLPISVIPHLLVLKVNALLVFSFVL